ncbi:MASE4 domain-containing protein [Massilia sp. IC2-477]|uniref:MASE4 domain-containing protein n=1 Tax=Massilia sp. IC2-477 TaxID=2887198 RepID=UPI001D0FDFC8|nr:MASE4 domain-containing protein [Massilia sp. IC2-477]MCC2958211.1 MASE4 domain-containing protein [Massilia sp. IC2-477]
MNYTSELPGIARDRAASADSQAAKTLFEYQAGPASVRLALIIVAVSLGMFVTLIPFARTPLAAAPWFIPLHQPVLVINDLITTTLLLGYFHLTRKQSILILACGYLYSAVMATVHLLSFPGVFTPTGLLGAGPQTTGYLHVFWHLGFPLAVIAYSFFKETDRRADRAGRTTTKAVLVTLAGAAVLATLATVGSDWLPQMLVDNRYSSVFNIGRYGQWIITGLALAILFTRRSASSMDMWLVVVLSAWFFEIGLVSVFNAGRWDLGFYAGRVYGLVASSFVLIMLLVEHGRMHRDLADAQATARTAARLQETQQVLGLALEAGKMGVFSWDLVGNRAWWSPEVEHDILGLQPGQLACEPGALTHYVFAEDRERLRAQIRDCIANRRGCDLEFRLRDAQGQARWASARGKAGYDEHGKATVVFGVLADITERKRGEAAAAEMEMHFHALADELPEIAWMARPDGWIYWFNRRWHEYTGLSQDEAEGWGWRKVNDPALVPTIVDRWRHSVATGEPYEMVVPLLGTDGRWRQFLSRAVALRNKDGQIIHWFGVNADITAQTEAEQVLKLADQRKDEFLATLAHELRNPLAPIRNAAALLLRMPGLPGNVERALAVIDRQSRHLARLVDDLLEVSRITQGKIALRKADVSLVDCLSDALHAVEGALKAAGHEVLVHLPDDPLYAHADSTRMVQCFLNLLNNAIKFTPQGGVISVSAERLRGKAKIAVSDSGIGIPPEHLEDIFGLFSQVTPALERSQGGLGIGLSLVKGFVELHGGTVEAASEGAGSGSTFTVWLPLLEQPPLAPADVARSSREARQQPRRVLVVDDNRDAATSMVALLQAAGHQVREAHDGEEGLRLAFEFEPEVVLLDLGMPGMSGFDVARELRGRTAQAPPRIIAVTGWGQESDRRLTREAGFDFHLTKPVNHTELDVLLSMDMPPAGQAAPVRH